MCSKRARHQVDLKGNVWAHLEECGVWGGYFFSFSEGRVVFMKTKGFTINTFFLSLIVLLILLADFTNHSQPFNFQIIARPKQSDKMWMAITLASVG